MSRKFHNSITQMYDNIKYKESRDKNISLFNNKCAEKRVVANECDINFGAFFPTRNVISILFALL